MVMICGCGCGGMRLLAVVLLVVGVLVGGVGIFFVVGSLFWWWFSLSVDVLLVTYLAMVDSVSLSVDVVSPRLRGSYSDSVGRESVLSVSVLPALPALVASMFSYSSYPSPVLSSPAFPVVSVVSVDSADNTDAYCVCCNDWLPVLGLAIGFFLCFLMLFFAIGSLTFLWVT
jgi:hypothetical protein